MNSALISQCEERWRDATLDHFTWAKTEQNLTTFPQRYFFCDRHWSSDPTSNSRGPIFFYVGNEADVLLYLNHTGLMWENAAEFGALLVFAEHRYYGASKPFAKTRQHMGYLTSEQAMADYAQLVTEIWDQYSAHSSPVVGFGGSYGGMLGTWMRLKYPHILEGVIAASAPIWDFFGEDPPPDQLYFSQGVTHDASPAAGSAAACIPNVKQAWDVLAKLGATQDGRDTISAALSLCEDSPLKDKDDVLELREWLGSAWDYMAMGDFPYPSSYMLNGNGELPAYPVKVACEHLADPSLEGTALLTAMGQAVGVFYNYSGDSTCYSLNGGPNPETDEDANFWDFQWCTEMFMPMAKDGATDMFWPEPFNVTEAVEGCRQDWGVTPDSNHATVEWGGRDLQYASNIVFTNGLLDPWHGGGVMHSLSETVVAVIIPEGAHHLDLMFTHPLDPPSVTAARRVELEHVRRWVRDGFKRRGIQWQPRGWAQAGALQQLLMGRKGSSHVGGAATGGSGWEAAHSLIRKIGRLLQAGL